MKRSSLRNTGTVGRAAARVLGLGITVAAAGSCNSFDTTRQATIATLGDDIYGVMCDRVGASSIPEDLSGASYNSICHFDANGKYGNTVDTTVLPAPTVHCTRTHRMFHPRSHPSTSSFMLSNARTTDTNNPPIDAPMAMVSSGDTSVMARSMLRWVSFALRSAR